MRYPPQQATLFLKEAEKVLAEDEPDDIRLRKLWLTLLFLRGAGIAQDLKNMLGPQVRDGPFKGMQLTPEAMVGNFSPHLLGCYEHELHETIERVISSGYRKIVNIGCSFGYYSVGLAMRMPQVSIDAFDINGLAQTRCRGMATVNGVADRINVSGEFRGEDFARYDGIKTLALVDIEGAELALLDPARWPALHNLDLIVEMHDLINSSISKIMLERFAASHECEVIRNREMAVSLQDILNLPPERYFDPFDNLIAAWEVRDGATPWGIFHAKNQR